MNEKDNKTLDELSELFKISTCLMRQGKKSITTS